eukprot:1652116-Prymnesium_polylepis.1
MACHTARRSQLRQRAPCVHALAHPLRSVTVEAPVRDLALLVSDDRVPDLEGGMLAHDLVEVLVDDALVSRVALQRLADVTLPLLADHLRAAKVAVHVADAEQLVQ